MKNPTIDITAILTVWKRNHLEEQLESLLQQTLVPSCIWVQQMQQNVNIDSIIEKFQSRIKYTYFSSNKGVFGRFESVMDNVDTSYTFIIDDDIIPGKCFLNDALQLSIHKNAIVSPAGRIIPDWTIFPDKALDREYMEKYFIGDGLCYPFNYCKSDTNVDFGNNAWLFRTEWMKYFSAFLPLTRKSGEDIHLSATCSLLGGIKTFVPKQTTVGNCGNLKRKYSFDEIALHKQNDFHSTRAEIVSRFRKKGWLCENTLSKCVDIE